MAYHVHHNNENGKIFAGTLNKSGKKWTNSSEVTQEAIEAVRDHFIWVHNHQEDNPAAVGYQWTLSDGKMMILKLSIEEKEETAE